MIFIINFKKNIATVYILCIIQGKFSYWQQFNQISLFEIDKNSKVGVYNIILPVNMTISLKIKSNSKHLFDF